MNTDTLRVWAGRLALIVASLVALLSILGGISFLQGVLRFILAYGLIYGLSELSLNFFEKTAITNGPIIDQNLGALLDIAVGEDESSFSTDGESELEAGIGTPPYGQAGYAQGGRGQAPLPGQVTRDLAHGLPSEEKQAEIVRRMGWGE